MLSLIEVCLKRYSYWCHEKVYKYWLPVEPLEWNEIRISGDLSSPLTRNRLSFCRRLLPNGIIVPFFPRSYWQI